jgi:uncharacterized protein YndB with AHSA1/START domain
MNAPRGDSATVSVLVKVSPSDAFAVFTEEIDLWWRTGPRYRIGAKRPGKLCIEGGPAGRLFESYETKAGPRTFEVGKVLVWEPPHRLSLEWRGVNFKPDESTLVEVVFEASASGTLVTVKHRGWSSLRPEHPARHGLEGSAFSRMIGLWWGELLSSLREHAEQHER